MSNLIIFLNLSDMPFFIQIIIVMFPDFDEKDNDDFPYISLMFTFILVFSDYWSWAVDTYWLTTEVEVLT